MNKPLLGIIFLALVAVVTGSIRVAALQENSNAWQLAAEHWEVLYLSEVDGDVNSDGTDSELTWVSLGAGSHLTGFDFDLETTANITIASDGPLLPRDDVFVFDLAGDLVDGSYVAFVRVEDGAIVACPTVASGPPGTN